MYTREEILNNYKKIDFPKSLFDESTLSNEKILFYPNSRLPSSTKEKDTSQLSQSYILPWKILHQKNYYINNSQNKKEFVRSGFTPFGPKEPLIELKTENFRNIYDKFSIPLEIKLIYLKYHNNISGPYNFEELQNMYKNKKYDSNYEFRTIDIFFFDDEEDTFNFFPIKNINEENWEEEFCDSPLLEHTNLFSKVKELLDASKKRKLEINELKNEIDDLKLQNDEKDIKIDELSKEIQSLKIKKELLNKKEKQNNKEEDEKEEDNKNEEKKEIEKEKIIEIEKKVIIDKKYDDEEEEKEIIKEEKIEIIQPKVLDMGEKWEIAGKKKKKVEKVQDDSKDIVGLSSKKSGGIKNNADSLIKMPGSTKTKKNKYSGEELVDRLRPKKKEEPKNEELSTTEFKEVKGKGKKKNKKQFEDSNIKLGFNY